MQQPTWVASLTPSIPLQKQCSPMLVSSPTGLCGMSMSSLLYTAPLEHAGPGDAEVSEEYLQRGFGGIPQRFHQERRSGALYLQAGVYAHVCIYISAFGIFLAVKLTWILYPRRSAGGALVGLPLAWSWSPLCGDTGNHPGELLGVSGRRLNIQRQVWPQKPLCSALRCGLAHFKRDLTKS